MAPRALSRLSDAGPIGGRHRASFSANGIARGGRTPPRFDHVPSRLLLRDLLRHHGSVGVDISLGCHDVPDLEARALPATERCRLIRHDEFRADSERKIGT
jgi:hypothetical protein